MSLPQTTFIIWGYGIGLAPSDVRHGVGEGENIFSTQFLNGISHGPDPRTVPGVKFTSALGPAFCLLSSIDRPSDEQFEHLRSFSNRPN